MRKSYQDQIKTKILENPNQIPQEHSTNSTWTFVEETVKEVAQSVLGTKGPKKKDRKIYSPIVDDLSKKSKNIRVNMVNAKDGTDLTEMRKQRNQISRQISNQLKYEHNARIQNIVNEIGEAGRAGNSKKMFRKAVKETTVLDSGGKVLVTTNEVYDTITDHYKNHFFKEDHQLIERCTENPQQLN